MILPRNLVSLFVVLLVGLFTPIVGEANHTKKAKKPVELVVIVPSYNNSKWCEKNLTSIFAQDYPRWKLYYIDDCSSDGMGPMVDKLVDESGLKSRCTVIHNPTRRGGLANLYNATHSCRPDQVIVTIDGDDWLANSHAFSHIASAYHDRNVWMTYGSYRCNPTQVRGICRKLPKDVMRKKQFRKYPWVTSHIRTYYAKLFQKIKKEDLQYQGEFFKVAQDLAIMFPLLEMASKGHIKYINKNLYIYNVSNPISDFAIRQQQQNQMSKVIRAKKPYHALSRLFSR